MPATRLFCFFTLSALAEFVIPSGGSPFVFLAFALMAEGYGLPAVAFLLGLAPFT